MTDAPQRVNENLRSTEHPLRVIKQPVKGRSPDSLSGTDVASDGLEANENDTTEVDSETSSNTRLTFLPILKWDDANDVTQVARSCNGCGRCRTSNPSERMCPMFRIGFGEEASPRSKANAMRGLLAGQLPMESIASDEMKKLADLCFQCHQCTRMSSKC